MTEVSGHPSLTEMRHVLPHSELLSDKDILDLGTQLTVLATLLLDMWVKVGSKASNEVLQCPPDEL